MKKKIITLMIAAAVSATALAGCGNAAEPANSSSIVNDKSTAGTVPYASSQKDSHTMAESSEDVAVDDKPAQGSIGESGLPYYELGFSPEDFSIYGFNIYSDETPDEVYNAINLLYHDELEKSISEGWSMKSDNTMLTFYKNNYGVIYYETSSNVLAIRFIEFEGNTIAGADFAQCSIIPGETTVSEAIDILGLRDLLDAMGIQGTAVEGNYDFVFESQFSKEILCRIRCSDDNNGFGINFRWMYEEKEVDFGFSVTNDIITQVGFLRDRGI